MHHNFTWNCNAVVFSRFTTPWNAVYTCRWALLELLMGSSFFNPCALHPPPPPSPPVLHCMGCEANAYSFCDAFALSAHNAHHSVTFTTFMSAYEDRLGVYCRQLRHIRSKHALNSLCCLSLLLQAACVCLAHITARLMLRFLMHASESATPPFPHRVGDIRTNPCLLSSLLPGMFCFARSQRKA